MLYKILRFKFIFCFNFLFCLLLNAQNNDSFQKKFETANILNDQKQYELAKDIWIELAEEYPNNANINFKTGFCLLNTTFQKKEALKYLNKAEENISIKYSPIDYTITTAPIETHYYLAKAYHHNYDIDSAIKYFKYFQNKGPQKHFLQTKIPTDLKQCENALALISHPKNYKLNNLGPNINSEFSDYNPCLTLDENTLFFTSKRTITDSNEQYYNSTIFNPQDGKHFDDVYVSYRDIKSGNWGKPELLDFCSADAPQATIAISGDGEKLFVYLGSKHHSDDEIYYTTREKDFYNLTPLNIFNSNSWENHVTISSDGKTLYFVSDRPGGLGGTDIWRCLQLPNGEWSQPYNIGPPINTKFNEESPFIHPDGKTLYFSSNSDRSMGGFDVFFSKRIDQKTFSNPINMGFPINTVDDDLFFSTSPDGGRGYYASSHEGGYGDNDIYMVQLKNVISEPVTILKGYIDKGKEKFLPPGIVIYVYDLDEDIEPMQYAPNKNNGSYVFTLVPCHEYDVEYTRTITKENGEFDLEIFHKQTFKVPCESNYKEINKPITIKGIDINGNIVEEKELEKIIDQLINDQPQVKFNELSLSEKKLIHMYLINDNGEIIGEAVLTENGFKFELLSSLENYHFKLENYPDNLDLSDILIDIIVKDKNETIKGNFEKDNSYIYRKNGVEKIQFNEFDLNSKKLIKLYLVDENGTIISEAALTEDGFKFELLTANDNYYFKLENYPENLDLGDIPIEINVNGEISKISGDFRNGKTYKYFNHRMNFKKNFGYNIYSIDKEKEFTNFINEIIVELKNKKSLDIEIIGSSSKVPTSAYKNNKELSQKRVNEAKKLLFKYLKQRGADISKVNIISERAIVSGPTYNYDYGNKAKYFEFQYFMISVK